MPNAIGMSVPGASSLMNSPSMSSMPSMADQVAGETDEQRRKRLQKLQAARQLPVGITSLGQGYGSAVGGQ